MKKIILLLLILVPAFLFAQYPATGNKQRLGYQTTGDGLIWRGVAADTAIKPRTTANAYFQLDTVNGVLRRYIATLGKWQTVGGGGSSIDSLVYSTIKGLNDSIQAEKQTLAFANPLLGISDGNNVDLSPLLSGYVTGSGTNNRVPKWSATSNLTDSNIQDNGTAVSVLSSKPFLLGQWTTAGRPSGVTGYMGYNTTGNGVEWYQGSRWAYALESTFARGTATRIPFFDANGQVTESPIFTLNTSTSNLNLTGRGVLNYRNSNIIIGTTTTLANPNTTSSTGDFHVLIGDQAGAGITSGRLNIMLGFRPGRATTSGSDNIILGTLAGVSNTIGNFNIFIGRNAGSSFTTQSRNIAIGDDAMLGTASTAINSIAIGPSALRAVTSGSQNSAYGNSSLFSLTTGSNNLALGFDSGRLLTTGSSNMFQGSSAGNGITTGSFNVLLGQAAGLSTTDVTASGAVGIGNDVFRISTALDKNIGIGFGAGFANTFTDVMLLGYQSQATANKQIKIGSSLYNSLFVHAGISVGVGVVPTRELDVNGDAYIRDSLRLTSTPPHASITGLLTRDANGWVGKARLGTDFVYEGDSIRLASAGNGIISALPLGNVAIAAAGNSLTIGGMSEVTLGGADWEIYSDDFETDIYNAEYAEIAAGTGAKVTLDNISELVEITGNVTALRESYYEINTTTSPATFSSSIPDNFVNQGGTQASFTFLFPASPEDGQILSITWGNAISTLTLDGNGNTITGSAVTTAVAGTRRQFKYYASAATWIKIY